MFRNFVDVLNIFQETKYPCNNIPKCWLEKITAIINARSRDKRQCRGLRIVHISFWRTNYVVSTIIAVRYANHTVYLIHNSLYAWYIIYIKNKNKPFFIAHSDFWEHVFYSIGPKWHFRLLLSKKTHFFHNYIAKWSFIRATDRT